MSDNKDLLLTDEELAKIVVKWSESGDSEDTRLLDRRIAQAQLAKCQAHEAEAVKQERERIVKYIDNIISGFTLANEALEDSRVNTICKIVQPMFKQIRDDIENDDLVVIKPIIKPLSDKV